MFGILSLLLSLELMLVQIRDLLSLPFSLFFIAFIFYILEKRTKNLLISILVSFLLFVDDSFLISQEKSFEKSNINIFCSYSIISSLFKQFSLAIKHNKSKIFHLSKLTKNFNSSPLDLRLLEDIVLRLKDIWQYL